MKSLSAVCALALALLALGTGTAHAVTITEYAVTVEGEATYARTDVTPAPNGQYEERETARFKWKTHVPSVTFIDKQLGATSMPSTRATTIDAERYVSFPTPQGPLTGACSGSLLAGPPGGGGLGESAIPTPDPNAERLDVRVLAGIGFILANCFGAIGGPESFTIDGSERPMPSGPFDHSFDMPHEAIGMGKIIQLLDANVTGSRCPGHGDGTVSCALTWKATVTFVRTAQHTPPPGGNQPLPAGGDGGSDRDDCLIPMPQPDPTCPDPDLDLIPLPPKRAKLARDAKQAKLMLTCRVACSGSATAYAVKRGARSSAARRPLARSRFIGAAGQPTTIVLGFRPKARRVIRRTRALRIELRVASQAGGATVRRTVVVRLLRARR
jgi:hypothetical protein